MHIRCWPLKKTTGKLVCCSVLPGVCVCVRESLCVCAYFCVCVYAYIYIYIYVYIYQYNIYICMCIYIYICLYIFSVLWLIFILNMTHSYVWHASFICVHWLIHMCDKCARTHSQVRHVCNERDSFMMCDHASFICETMTHSYVWPWLVHICDHDSYTRVPHPHAVYTKDACRQAEFLKSQLATQFTIPNLYRTDMWEFLPDGGRCASKGKILNRLSATKFSIQTDCQASFWEFPSSSTPPCSASSFKKNLESHLYGQCSKIR